MAELCRISTSPFIFKAFLPKEEVVTGPEINFLSSTTKKKKKEVYDPSLHATSGAALAGASTDLLVSP